MLQQEFTKRVGLEVSAQEYAHIEQVYMASDLDKDEFCKQWVKMNKERVAKAKAIAKAVEADLRQREQLWNIVMKFDGLSWEKYNQVAEDAFTETQKKKLANVGITMYKERIDGWTGHRVLDRKSVSSVIYEVKMYLGAVA